MVDDIIWSQANSDWHGRGGEARGRFYCPRYIHTGVLPDIIDAADDSGYWLVNARDKDMTGPRIGPFTTFDEAKDVAEMMLHTGAML